MNVGEGCTAASLGSGSSVSAARWLADGYGQRALQSLSEQVVRDRRMGVRLVGGSAGPCSGGATVEMRCVSSVS